MRVHLIGIAGTAMASLARLLLELGHTVSGSDEGVYPPMSTELERMGVAVSMPYRPENLEPPPDLVVIGNAIPRGNPELEACLDRNLLYTSQAEAIEDLILPGRTPIVVAGTHGKTTTTTLIAWMLTATRRSPGWFVGGVPFDLPTSAQLGSGPEIVLEGDEYDTAYFDKRPKFHHYRPRILIVGNLEHDHADIYPDLESIASEFRRLVNTVPQNGLIAVGADSPPALEVVRGARCPVVRYGFDASADYRASDYAAHGDGCRFTLARPDGTTTEILLGTAGKHSTQNGLAAIVVADHLGLPGDLVAKALADFRGVKRRLELRGTPDGVAVFDDFAHHPTAIRATIEALRARGGDGRLWAVLEPRSWSMRRNLHQDALPDALEAADVVLVTPVYQADRVPGGELLDTARVIADLVARGCDARQVSGADEVVAIATAETAPGDQIALMSNGGFDGVHDRLLDALGQRRRSPAGTSDREPR